MPESHSFGKYGNIIISALLAMCCGKAKQERKSKNKFHIEQISGYKSTGCSIGNPESYQR